MSQLYAMLYFYVIIHGQMKMETCCYLSDTKHHKSTRKVLNILMSHQVSFRTGLIMNDKHETTTKAAWGI